MAEEHIFKSDLVSILGAEFKIKPWQAENTLALLDEGATIPFIARYQKGKNRGAGRRPNTQYKRKAGIHKRP